MAINSVSSSTSANAQLISPQTQQARAATQDQPKTQAKRQAEAPKQAEAPRPVVNTQGQKTGTVINTTA